MIDVSWSVALPLAALALYAACYGVGAWLARKAMEMNYAEIELRHLPPRFICRKKPETPPAATRRSTSPAAHEQTEPKP